MRMKKLGVVLLGGVLAAAFAGSAQAAYAGTLTLGNVSAGNVTLKVGQTYNIGASSDTKGKISYSSTKSSVVSVSSKGKLKAKKPGKAAVGIKLKDSDGTTRKYIDVKVVKKSQFKKVKGVTVGLTQKRAGVGATVTASAVFNPSKPSNKNVKFSSSNKKVATVNADGKIKCFAKGTTTITVKSIDGGKKGSAKLTVGDLEANKASDFTYEVGTYLLDGAIKNGKAPSTGTWEDGETIYTATAQYGSYLKGDLEASYHGVGGDSGAYGPFKALLCGEGVYITGVKSSAKGYMVIPDSIDGKPVVCVSLNKTRKATGFNFSLCNSLKAVAFGDSDSCACMDSIDFGSSNLTVQSFELAYNGVDQMLDLTPLTDLRALSFNRTNGVHDGWAEDTDVLEYYYEEFVGFSWLNLVDKANLKEVVVYGDGYNNNNFAISNVPNLEVLNISANSFGSFDTLQFPALREFTCDNNLGIKALDVSKNEKLEVLNCNETDSLSSIDLGGNPELRKLALSCNKLTKLDLSANPKLEELWCSWNMLTELDLSTNSKLEKLQCSSNKISNLNVSDCTALKSIDCGTNRIASLDLSSMNQLQTIEADESGLVSLTIPINGALESISATDCKFDSRSFDAIVSWAIQPGHYASIDGFEDEYDDDSDYWVEDDE